MMKPKGQTEHDEGMLEYLEDIIGSERLKQPIEILCRRVEALNQQRGEKVNLDFLQVSVGFVYTCINTSKVCVYVCFIFFILLLHLQISIENPSLVFETRLYLFILGFSV